MATSDVGPYNLRSDGEPGIHGHLGWFRRGPAVFSVYEIPPEWSWGERQNFFIGPNFAFRGDEWALTTTALWLADGEASAPLFELRLLFEFDF